MGVATGIIVGSLVSGYFASRAASSQSEAEQQATNAQTQAGHEALDFEKQQLEYEQQLAAQKLQYEQEQQLKHEADQRRLASQLSPYVNLGSGALRNLGSLANVPTTTPTTGPTPSAPASLPPNGNIGPGTSGPMGPGVAAPSGPAMQGGSLSALAPSRAAFGSAYTLMASPDGEQRQIPSDQVERFKALGAKVVQ